MTNLYQFQINKITGEPLDLNQYEGKAVLLVNVASKCGLTPQYEALQALYQAERENGLEIIGLPCNQFMQQEPGSAEEILQFCESKYNVDFQLSEKIEVNGEKRHPLYTWLAGDEAKFPGDIKWNFEKFLLDRNGEVVARFEPTVKPDDGTIKEKLKQVL